MKFIKHVLLAAAVGIAATLPSTVLAQAAATDSAAVPKPVAVELTEAEVRKVDRGNRKITLKHGAIKNLDMPPMTMVFGVSDTALLDKVKQGDKVLFAATAEGGKYTVKELRPAR